MILETADCAPGETSPPTRVNLRMVDDDFDELQGIMVDSAKTVQCKGGEQRTHKRTVRWQGPVNCKDSDVPTTRGGSIGDITATVSIAGQPDYVETLTIKCFK